MKAKLPLLFFLLIALNSCKSSFEITNKEVSQYKFTDTSFTEVDSTLYKEITPFREKMKDKMSEVLIVSTTTLERGNPESRLGNFMADACLIATQMHNKQADFAVFNSGGLRKGMPQGEITRGDIFELMPFENEIVILTMTGSEVKKLVNFIALKGGAPVSGLRMRIQDSIATNVLIGNVAFDSTRTYRVLTSDYLANGGDSFPLMTSSPWDTIALKVRDAIIEYLAELNKQKKKLTVELDGRIINGR